MRPLARVIVLISFLAGLGWAAITATHIAQADRLVLDASTEMAAWSAMRSEPEEGTRNLVHARLAEAERIVPTDPTTHELLGLLSSMRSESAERLAQGVEHMVKALELRPSSPYTWAHLAEAKYRQGEPGRNLQLAFLRASELGPAEPGVQRIVANYGLAVWDEIDPPTRAAIDRLLAAGFRRNPLEMLQISERRGRLDVACRHLVGDPRTRESKWAQMCQVGREP